MDNTIKTLIEGLKLDGIVYLSFESKGKDSPYYDEDVTEIACLKEGKPHRMIISSVHRMGQKPSCSIKEDKIISEEEYKKYNEIS